MSLQGGFGGEGTLNFALGNSLPVPNPDGTFTAAGTYAAMFYYAGSGGDFNRDGNIDVAVVDYASSFMTVYSGNGDGTFSAARTYVVNSDDASDISVADLT